MMKKRYILYTIYIVIKEKTNNIFKVKIFRLLKHIANFERISHLVPVFVAVNYYHKVLHL